MRPVRTPPRGRGPVPGYQATAGTRPPTRASSVFLQAAPTRPATCSGVSLTEPNHKLGNGKSRPARTAVRTLAQFRFGAKSTAAGSQDGEPFGEEPPGVWGSLSGHLPWETELRESSGLVQTGSRPTSHRGGHQAAELTCDAALCSVSAPDHTADVDPS